MEKPDTHPRSHLFTVRVWQEKIGTDQSEWRGKVQVFPAGDVRYFRAWETLVPLLLLLLSDSEPDTQLLLPNSELDTH